MVADDVDDRRRRPARVVQIGEAVGEAGTQVQERRGGLAGDAAIAVGGAGSDALEQAQHAAQARVRIEGADQVHLGSARIGETNLDAAIDQRLRESLRAVHVRAPRFRRAILAEICPTMVTHIVADWPAEAPAALFLRLGAAGLRAGGFPRRRRGEQLELEPHVVGADPDRPVDGERVMADFALQTSLPSIRTRSASPSSMAASRCEAPISGASTGLWRSGVRLR